MTRFTSIVITGASSGLGRALAIDYAAPGIALALNGRNAERLRAVAEVCRAKGASVDIGLLDVTDREALTAWLIRFDDAHPVDLVVANAGISIERDNSAIGDFSIMRKTLEVNLGGVLNTVEALLGRLVGRHRGQVALISSLAAFIGLPQSAAYNASKAAVRVWGESLRYALQGRGVGVSIICPGYVDTPMTDAGPSPGAPPVPAERASHIIRRGLARNKARIAFPIGARTAVWLGAALPFSWTYWWTCRSERR